jgi:hypothetical protein
MQIKYLSALKTKYASFGLSKEALDRVASQRVKTIENESEIDSDVASSETAMLIMKEMQGATDALRNNNARIQKELDSLKTNVPTQTTQPQTTPTPDNALAEELKQIKEMFAGMKASMDADKKKARTETILAQAHKVMEQNGCINEFIRKITLNGVEVGEADTAESIAEKYKSVYDQNCKDAFGEGYVPPRSNSKSGGETDQAEVTRILQSRGLLPKESN